MGHTKGRLCPLGCASQSHVRPVWVFSGSALERAGDDVACPGQSGERGPRSQLRVESQPRDSGEKCACSASGPSPAGGWLPGPREGLLPFPPEGRLSPLWPQPPLPPPAPRSMLCLLRQKRRPGSGHAGRATWNMPRSPVSQVPAHLNGENCTIKKELPSHFSGMRRCVHVNVDIRTTVPLKKRRTGRVGRTRGHWAPHTRDVTRAVWPPWTAWLR